MSLWSDIGNLFKSKEEKKREELRKKLIEQRQEELNDRLAELDNAYNEKNKETPIDWSKILPEELDVDYKTFEGLTDDEIKDKADSMLKEYYESGINEINNSFDAKYDDALNDKEKIASDLNNKVNDIEREYSAKKENTRNSNIRNGIMKSSISDLMQEEIDDAESYEKSRTTDEANIRIKAIDDEIENLTKEQEDAISELNLEHATKLNESIDKLKKERDKAYEEVLEYNNKLKEKQADYKADREEKIAELEKKIADKKEKEAELENKYGYTGDKLREYEKRLKVAHSFYDTLSKDEALDAIKNNSRLKSYLGKFYDRLLSEVGERTK